VAYGLWEIGVRVEEVCWYGMRLTRALEGEARTRGLTWGSWIALLEGWAV
jgi:hypothetical protein